MFVTHDGMLSVSSITTQDKKLLGSVRGGQLSNRIYRANINIIWKHIRGIYVSFVWKGNIINGNWRYIQSWEDTINRKGVVEAVIKFPITVLSVLN